MIRTCTLLLALTSALVCSATTYAQGRQYTKFFSADEMFIVENKLVLQHRGQDREYVIPNNEINRALTLAHLRGLDRIAITYVKKTDSLGRTVRVITGYAYAR